MTETILVVCGVITAVAGAIAAINKYIIQPLNQIQKTLDEVKEIKEGQKILMKSTASLLEHIITGNHIEKLKTDYDTLIDFAIDK